MTNFLVVLVSKNSKRTGNEYVGTYSATDRDAAGTMARNDPYFATLPERSRKGVLTVTPA